MRIIHAAALLAAATATPAFAQQGSASMTGFHVEGLVGYDSTEIADDSEGGILYGARAGYDFQSGRAVFGIEAEANDSTNEGCVTGIAAANDSLCVGAGRELFFGGRAGFIVGRNVLLYGTAGYTNARFDVDYDDGTAGGAGNFVDHANLDGVRIGAGAQFGVGRNAYFRTELRYANYEQGSDRGQVVGAFGFRF
jgi:outer membrane immunogenic protein